ncbi:hypothetical protein O9929_18055 [Vibrio lentus]|nr:hypothetical protein [Vibrio lentus]
MVRTTQVISKICWRLPGVIWMFMFVLLILDSKWKICQFCSKLMAMTVSGHHITKTIALTNRDWKVDYKIDSCISLWLFGVNRHRSVQPSHCCWRKYR